MYNRFKTKRLTPCQSVGSQPLWWLVETLVQLQAYTCILILYQNTCDVKIEFFSSVAIGWNKWYITIYKQSK